MFGIQFDCYCSASCFLVLWFECAVGNIAIDSQVCDKISCSIGYNISQIILEKYWGAWNLLIALLLEFQFQIVVPLNLCYDFDVHRSFGFIFILLILSLLW